MVTVYFAHRHTLDPRVWSKGQNIFFLLHIKLKGLDHRAPHKHIFCTYTHHRPGVGVKRSKHFSESSHVTYQIKGNGAWSTMQAHTLSLRTISAPGWGHKIRIFVSEVVMLRIKLKKIARRAPCKHLFCPNTHPRSVGTGQKVKAFILIVFMLHTNLKGKKHRPT